MPPRRSVTGRAKDLRYDDLGHDRQPSAQGQTTERGMCACPGWQGRWICWRASLVGTANLMHVGT